MKGGKKAKDSNNFYSIAIQKREFDLIAKILAQHSLNSALFLKITFSKGLQEEKLREIKMHNGRFKINHIPSLGP